MVSASSPFADDLELKIPQSLLDQVANGNAESAYFIATQFDEKSKGDDELYTQAKQWMQKAADMGYPQAMYELAQMFDYEKLQSKALEWYLKASKFGHSEAIYSVASIYMQGSKEQPADCQKAYQWYEKAEAKDNIVAYNDHAWSLATSADKQCRNPEKALKVFSNVKAYYNSSSSLMPLAYIDTEAAIHAAVADFSRAINLQQQALDEMDKDSKSYTVFLDRLNIYKKRQTWIQH
jgi:hypothetical protein